MLENSKKPIEISICPVCGANVIGGLDMHHCKKCGYIKPYVKSRYDGRLFKNSNGEDARRYALLV